MQGNVKGPRVHGVPEEDSLKHLECIVQLVSKHRVRKNSVRTSAPASLLVFSDLGLTAGVQSVSNPKFCCVVRLFKPLRSMRLLVSGTAVESLFILGIECFFFRSSDCKRGSTSLHRVTVKIKRL